MIHGIASARPCNNDEMNLHELYKAVYETEAVPTDEELTALSKLMSALPDEVFNAVFQHYVHNKTIETIAEENNVPVHKVEHWRKSGVAMMRAVGGRR